MSKKRKKFDFLGFLMRLLVDRPEVRDLYLRDHPIKKDKS